MSCVTKNGVCTSMGSAGCNKLNVFDWLSDIPIPEEDKRYVQVSFDQGARKEFFINKERLELFNGVYVCVVAGAGFDVGKVTLQGVLALKQMKKQKIDVSKAMNEFSAIKSIATEDDFQLLDKAKKRESAILEEGRIIIQKLKLDMKLSKVNVQADQTKIIFYYTANMRVDFRELIKHFTTAFEAKVEMKQVSARKETGILGGIGSCGRELCCSSWLDNPPGVNISAAKYQDLSINGTKLNGQCGRLKCCLNYELDVYLEALQDFPKADKIYAEPGVLKLIKKDIFKKWMYYRLPKSDITFAIHVEDVHKMSTKKYTMNDLEAVNQLTKQNQTLTANDKLVVDNI